MSWRYGLIAVEAAGHYGTTWLVNEQGEIVHKYTREGYGT